MDEASTPSFNYATIGSRFVAVLIDGILLSIVSAILFRDNPAFSGILNIAYQTYFLSRNGQTLGKQAMKVRVVTTNGEIPSVETALIRVISSYLSGAVFLIGYIWAFFNKERQTWHDLIAKTYVIEAEPVKK